MRVFASYFKLEVESVSRVKANFLNLTAYASSGSIRTRWFMKPTALTIPLEHTSSQPWFVHQTWPRAMMRTVAKLCSTTADAQHAIKTLRQAFSSSITRVLWPDGEPEQLVKSKCQTFSYNAMDPGSVRRGAETNIGTSTGSIRG